MTHTDAANLARVHYGRRLPETAQEGQRIFYHPGGYITGTATYEYIYKGGEWIIVDIVEHEARQVNATDGYEYNDDDQIIK